MCADYDEVYGTEETYDEYIMHYGVGHLDGGNSGRYPYGSGEDPYQHAVTFLDSVHELKKKGVTEANIAKMFEMTTTELRAEISMSKDTKIASERAKAVQMFNQGKTASQIAREMGKNESTIRSLLEPVEKDRTQTTKNIADLLRARVDEKGFIDVGVGSELYVKTSPEESLGVSRTKLQTAVKMLEKEGYETINVQVDQLGTQGNQKTYVLTLCPPGTTYKDVVANKDKIQMITDVHSDDGGITFRGLKPPVSIDSSRVYVKFDEEGGTKKDGVIELRKGIEDISLGNSNYAQVRIAVDGTHYMKGMAMYSDDIPEGYDIVYNSNKPSSKGKLGAMKPMSDDPDNPFGATIKMGPTGQRMYTDPKTGETKQSVINIINEEGDWGEWSKTLSAQMLSKQSRELAKKQLDLDTNIRKAEYDEIMKITNPAVQKKLLESFADDCDAAAVHLKAAAMPRQASHVLLPITNMDPSEIYAPNYNNGERVVLIRYPHGGTFEIPELIVNNNQRTAKKLLGQAKDAVGISLETARKLSGADFDGDSALVIPNNNGDIKTSILKQLDGFDPSACYPEVPGMKLMTDPQKQQYMGQVSNLITDMTIKGASGDEIARAVKHSMVVIDAVKHKLNYEQSYIDNGIAELKEKYQGGKNKGASTLISRAAGEVHLDQRKEGKTVVDPKTGKVRRVYIDPETGKKLYENTGKIYTFPEKDKDGNPVIDPKTGEQKVRLVKATTLSTQMAEKDDAFDLSSGTAMETIYAKYANTMKAMGNDARKTMLQIENPKRDPEMAKLYAEQVKSLKAQLFEAQMNAPLERQAQLLANAVIDAKKRDKPNMEKDELKKIKGQALAAARVKIGAKKKRVVFSAKEWEAVQKGAVSNNLLVSLLNNADMDTVKKLATPRNERGITPAKARQARLMLNRGYTQAEIAEILGVSTTTINKLAKGES